MTFNPEGFVDMKDKYFLLNGRSYPDTVTSGPMETQTSDGRNHFSQPLPSIINIPAGGKALCAFPTWTLPNIRPWPRSAFRCMSSDTMPSCCAIKPGTTWTYYTNSITLAGGESLDVILDASNTTLYPAGYVFYLYTPQLDHLANDAENFGGLMTEVHIN
jgi:hypothetical protein